MKKNLEYFKSKLLEILTAKEKEENKQIKKALKQLELNQVLKSIDGALTIEKANFPIGTVREWKGQKFRKIAPNKWRRVYESNSRGAMQSIRYIKNKIQNAQSVDELLQIVMENTNRFMDSNGNLLPIVEELKNSVTEKKTQLNSGKPSTQEQIDKINAENKKPDTPQSKFENYINARKEDVNAILTNVKDPDMAMKMLQDVKNSAIDEARDVLIDANSKITNRSEFAEVKNNIYEQWDNFGAWFYNAVKDVYQNTTEYKEQKEKRDKEKNALQTKIDSINKEYKYEYSADEIKKSYDEVEKLKPELEKLKESIKNQKKEERELNIQRANLRQKLNYKEMQSSAEYQTVTNRLSEIYRESVENHSKVQELEEKINPYMDAIAYDLLTKDYEKDSKIDSCKTAAEVEELIKSKDWYSDEGKEKFSLKSVDIEGAKTVYKALERIYALFPEMKGSNKSITTRKLGKDTWAQGAGWSGMELNTAFWKDSKKIDEELERENGFHPKNCTKDQVIFHEYFHVMTVHAGDSPTPAKIKKAVTNKLKMSDRKTKVKVDDVIKEGVSRYASKNADEFGAECFGECLSSKTPSAFAREVFKEVVKHVKYLGDN